MTLLLAIDEIAWLDAKNALPPTIHMKEITIPKKLRPLVEAFFAESKEAVKALIIQTSRAIYGINDNPSLYERHEPSSDELESVCALMRHLMPCDVLEALFAAQIVVSHMLGMKNFAYGRHREIQLGIKQLRFSSEALAYLQKKRSGSIQNITVNYNHLTTEKLLIQALDQKEE